MLDLKLGTAMDTGHVVQIEFSKCMHVPPAAAVLNLCCIIALLLWRPDPDQLPVFFVFPALWGMGDAVWQTQTNGKLPPLNFPRNDVPPTACDDVGESCPG